MSECPLKHCPDCGYDLHGLPPRHRCPECGFEYDEHTCVWRATKFGMLGPALFLIPGFAILLREITHHGFTPVRHGILANFALLCEAFVVCTLAVFAYMLRTRSTWFIAITPQGIVTRTFNGDVRLTWREIEASAEAAGIAPQQQIRDQLVKAIMGKREARDVFWHNVELTEVAAHAVAAFARHEAARGSQPAAPHGAT